MKKQSLVRVYQGDTCIYSGVITAQERKMFLAQGCVIAKTGSSVKTF